MTDPSYSVADVTVSPDGKWIGYHGMSASRYERGNLEQNDYADLYLYDVASAKIERLTKNDIIGETPVAFSPDSKTIAFSAPDDFKFMHLEKIYVRPVDRPTEQWKKLGGTFDYDVRIGRGFGGDAGIENAFWSANGDTIYFNTGFHATTQMFALVVADERGEAAHQLQGVDLRRPRRGDGPLHHHLRRSKNASRAVHGRVAPRRRRQVEVDAAHRSQSTDPPRHRARR